jgi:GDP-D-mannose 3',5'-epimerase
VPGVECLSMDLSEKANAIRAVEGAAEVYNLAADMGGMGFIEHFRVECLRSILVNTHLIDAAWRAGAERYFFSSSACAYNTDLQKDPNVRALKESDAYPAMSERGYGWEKLISEMFCQEYWAERGLETHIARFHNIYGPHGTWFGGREKAPAAMCRKVIEAQDSGDMRIEIWGDGTQTRSFCFIEDCVLGIDQIMHCDRLIATPINLGSSELISIDDLVSMVERIAGVKLERTLRPECAQGRGRAEQRQHVHPQRSRLGAAHSPANRHGKDLRVDRAAICRPQSRQAGGEGLSVRDSIASIIGSIPHRMALAGGWIDQPFISALNPDPPGSMVVVGLEPDRWFMDRCGIASGTRKVALAYGAAACRTGRRAELVRELYRAENEGARSPPGRRT